MQSSLKTMRYSLILLFSLASISLACQHKPDEVAAGASRLSEYLPLLEGKRIALVANHTSLVGESHLLDVLMEDGNEVLRVFCPEHGFRGEAAAGARIEDNRDPISGVQVVSLYGSHRKPRPEDLKDVDIVVFDLQDVGARFFTYISTLHYVMEACAENGVSVLVLDRPNPNGNYIDGPVLDPSFRSFVGMHPIPVVYGLTMGELAGMINGEGWLEDGVECDLKVIPCLNYSHQSSYSMPVRPSPNLGNDHSIRLYPSTCFFEGTVLSEGRGTAMPFEVFGHPDLDMDFRFTPVTIPGVSGNPKFKDVECRGRDLRAFNPQDGFSRLYLGWLIEAWERFPDKDSFFTGYFDTLAGTSELREQIEAGWDEARIRASWQEGLETYKRQRKPYLLYP